MTVMAPEETRLIAPLESIPMQPPGLLSGPTVPVGLPDDPTDSEFFADTREEGFLINARELAASHPRSATARVRLAQAEQAAGNDERAVEEALKALAAIPHDAADVATAVAAIQTLLWSGAVEEAAQSLNLVPPSPYRALIAAHLAADGNNFDEALDHLTDFTSPATLATRAWLFLRLSRFPEAVRTLRELLKEVGPTASSLTNLGYAYAALGSLDKAIRVTREARELDSMSRLIAFNLASYHRALGNLPDALNEIRRLQRREPDDLQLFFAEADLRLALDDVEGAERTLRRARTSSMWITASLLQRAELEANLTFVRWRLGRLERRSALKDVLEQLRRTDFDSLDIAGMLPALSRAEDVAEVEAAFSSLREKHPEEPFHYLSVHSTFLRGEFERATDLALDWAKRAPFSATAAGAAAYLLVDVRGDFEEAAKLGLWALQRNRASKQLVNNTAYALALAGRLAEARRLLPADTDDVHLTATRALIDLLGGNEQRGIEGYRRAHGLAEARDDRRLAVLVRCNEVLFRALAHRRRNQLSPDDVLTLPGDWAGDPDFALIKHAADRMEIPTQVDD